MVPIKEYLAILTHNTFQILRYTAFHSNLPRIPHTTIFTGGSREITRYVSACVTSVTAQERSASFCQTSQYKAVKHGISHGTGGVGQSSVKRCAVAIYLFICVLTGRLGI